ncbi:MAG: type II toxin-antitoxin system HicA family toxin [Chloroflexaceae bacterium]|nr:type II toxin-antitoxin system HicA family toxin [Chloroflexaceae bacterium]
MKRKEFIRELETVGCILHRQGSKHDIYRNSATEKKAPIRRHTEIKDSLCRLIRKQLDWLE